VRTGRLRDLRGAAPPPGRVFWSGIWFRAHTNARYAELLPRLDRLDALFFTCSARRVPRGVQFRAYRGRPGVELQRAVTARAAARYRGLLCTEFRQIELFGGPVVVDVDDPYFEEPETTWFRRPNVVAFVTVAQWAADRFRELGVTAPIHVVPQGVDLSTLTPVAAADARARLRRDGEIVIGYHAASIATEADGGNPLYHVDHLLGLWSEIHRRAPRARLWLIGEATGRARAAAAAHEGVTVLGRVPRDRLLAHVAAYDIGLYPRLKSDGIRAAKVAEYLGAGVPVVAYDYPVVSDVREAGAGLLVATPRELVDAVVGLAGDEAARRRLAEAARAAGAKLDWDELAARYAAEILDRYLPR
jgi:glycosyltransferase involved in cell wall biosynthesis